MTVAQNIDIVLLIDTSESMRPCIEGLKAHLRELIKPVQGFGAKIRFGVVGFSASMDNGYIIFHPETLAGEGFRTFEWLYKNTSQHKFFTDNPDEVIERLDKLVISGDEDTLVGLDLALDHPFGPNSTHKRVIAMFSDEALEDGIPAQGRLDIIPALVRKINARNVKLFCAMPWSVAAGALAEADGCELEIISDDRGLAKVDFGKLLGQMGKSISAETLQGGPEQSYDLALFGQDKWGYATKEFVKTDNK